MSDNNLECGFCGQPIYGEPTSFGWFVAHRQGDCGRVCRPIIEELRADNEALRKELAETRSKERQVGDCPCSVCRPDIKNSDGSRCLICGGNHGGLQCPQTVVT